jgi:hypothetical protein
MQQTRRIIWEWYALQVWRSALCGTRLPVVLGVASAPFRAASPPCAHEAKRATPRYQPPRRGRARAPQAFAGERRGSGTRGMPLVHSAHGVCRAGPLLGRAHVRLDARMHGRSAGLGCVYCCGCGGAAGSRSYVWVPMCRFHPTSCSGSLI